jgi:hypothetical protein
MTSLTYHKCFNARSTSVATATVNVPLTSTWHVGLMTTPHTWGTNPPHGAPTPPHGAPTPHMGHQAPNVATEALQAAHASTHSDKLKYAVVFFRFGGSAEGLTPIENTK